MLVFQAFPFSLSILWRYIVVFPVMIVALLVYGLIGGLISGLIGLILPPASILIMFFVGASSGVIPILVGSRLGLQARHVKPSNGYGKFVFPAIIYGAVEAIGIGVATALAMMFAFGAVTLGVGDISSDPAAYFSNMEPARIAVFLAMMLLLFAAICALRAAFLVPIAAASIGRDPDGRPYTPFLNFGAFFWPLFFVVAISYIAMMVLLVVIFVGVIMLSDAGILTDDLELVERMVDGTAPFSVTWSMVMIALIYIVITGWAFCIQCAGGVLAFLRLSGHAEQAAPSIETLLQPTPQPVAGSAPRMTAEELRALRKSRQVRE